MKVGQYNPFTIIERVVETQGMQTQGTQTRGTTDDEIPSYRLISADGMETSLSVDHADSDESRDWQPGATVTLFVRTDDNGQPQVTQEKPRLTLHHSALLPVVNTTDAGSWLDWGMTGDLFMPRTECKVSVRVGMKLVVCLYRDQRTSRLAASARLHRFFAEHDTDLQPGQSVSLMIATHTELGFKAIIDQQYLGLLYADEVFQSLAPGDELTGYVKDIRPDGKVDLTLQAKPQALRSELGERILHDLRAGNGRSTLTDKSPPDEIYARYQVSKKNYKKALGHLYKDRLIVIGDTDITLVKPES